MQYDIDWVLSAPSLMNLPEDEDASLWLKALNQNSNPSPSFKQHSEQILPKKDAFRLGAYYEYVIEIIINSLLKDTDIKRNIQVKKDKITLGEFDFIGGNSRSGFHLECAIKYYLRIGTGEDLADFVGPSKRDRLDLKWHKIRHQQIRLSETEAGLQMCNTLGIQPNMKKTLLQGILFHPFLDQECPNLHEEINPDHDRGWWLREKDIGLLNTDDRFIEMKKPFWLSAHISTGPTPTELIPTELNSKKFTPTEIGPAQLINVLNTNNRPLLVSRGHTIDGKWVERDRGFIVANDW